mmetsp:Transcript_38019/g.74462  ORF Transcript_38019/g.74462 Transcript_38019/m.74462 type:complete len:271 (+) Transcript_38019:829-1641(+)
MGEGEIGGALSTLVLTGGASSASVFISVSLIFLLAGKKGTGEMSWASSTAVAGVSVFLTAGAGMSVAVSLRESSTAGAGAFSTGVLTVITGASVVITGALTAGAGASIAGASIAGAGSSTADAGASVAGAETSATGASAGVTDLQLRSFMALLRSCAGARGTLSAGPGGISSLGGRTGAGLECTLGAGTFEFNLAGRFEGEEWLVMSKVSLSETGIFEITAGVKFTICVFSFESSSAFSFCSTRTRSHSLRNKTFLRARSSSSLWACSSL